MSENKESNSPKVIVSGMRPTGLLHLGHYFGVLQNWKKLQSDYDCYFFVADWHSLTTEYDNTEIVRNSIKEMVVDWLASGIDPNQVTLFIQSKVPEHAELHLLLSMITPIGWLERVPSYKDMKNELKHKDLSTYGFLGYPLLQTADVALYHANLVPVGQDQVAHIELSREVLRRFNFLYSEIFPEPQALLTKTPKVPGLDGRKMSKSYNNSIYLSDSAEAVEKKIKQCLTDPARQRKTDKGNPEKCTVFDYHKQVTPSEKREEIIEACQNATIGCVDCKKILGQNLNDHLGEFREKRNQIIQDMDIVDDVMNQGAIKAGQIAKENLSQTKEVMGINI